MVRFIQRKSLASVEPYDSVATFRFRERLSNNWSLKTGAKTPFAEAYIAGCQLGVQKSPNHCFDGGTVRGAFV